MSGGEPLPSFRDPDGAALVLPDCVRRFVRPHAWPTVQAYAQSGSARRLSEAEMILPWRQAEGEPAGGGAALSALAAAEGWAAAIDQDRLPFASYPHEWPAEMLHSAGALLLNIHEDMLRDSFGLKDATPYNVLFRGPQPVHVDVLSAETRDPGDPFWLAEAQWSRTVELPLLAAAAFGIPPHVHFLSSADGLTPDALYRMAGPLRRLSPGFLGAVSLPVWLSRRAERAGSGLYQVRRMEPARAAFVREKSLQRLRRRLRCVETAVRSSHWASYDTDHNYGAADVAAKEDFVGASLDTAQPGSVLDLGCNVGRFSLMAADSGARVVAVDSDPAVVGRLWWEAAATDADILPLVVDIARPTPALGWRNGECRSFMERATKGFDMVLALALVHHLLVTERIPLAEIVDAIASLTRKFAAIEYVAPEDDYFRRLCRGRENLHEGLTEEVFRRACEARFDVIRRQAVNDGRRVLYFLSLK